jgi:integrase/recombinase XerD
MDFLKFSTFSLGTHRDIPVIWIKFEKDVHKIAILKKSIKAFWSQSQKSWYCYDNSENRKITQIDQHNFNFEYLKIHPVNQDAYKEMSQTLVLKGYSQNTIRTYLNEFLQLLKILKAHPVVDLDANRIKAYLLYCIQTLGLSENLIHSRLNALKFYFEQVLLKDNFFVEIPRPKKPSLLPKVLSTAEIKRLFNQTANIKHQILLKLSYGLGLRVSEIVHLKIENIDSARMMVHVQNAKGKKDRYVPLPESILVQLREYYVTYKPQTYLFEGKDGKMYAPRSVQAVFKNAMKAARIHKKVGIHGLRHSYATHLMEYGTDMLFIQKLLGHENIKTTEIYAKVSKRQLANVKSPLDRI